MNLDIFVDINLIPQQPALSRDSFDTVGLLTDGPTTVFTGRDKLYAPGEIEADFGAAASSKETDIVENAIFAQNPRIKKVRMLREDAADTGNITTIYNAVKAADFFALLPINRIQADIETLSALVEPDFSKMLFVGDDNALIKDSGTSSDLASVLKALLVDRTAVFSDEGSPEPEFLPGASLSRILGLGDVGLATWNGIANLKNVVEGAPATGEITTLDDKNATHYVKVTSNSKATVGGKVASGKFIDSVRGQSALRNAIQIGLVELLINADKIPFTNNGISMVKAAIETAIAPFEGTYLVTGVTTVDVPDITEVLQVDKEARLLKGIVVSVLEQGAIHKISLTVGVRI